MSREICDSSRSRSKSGVKGTGPSPVGTVGSFTTPAAPGGQQLLCSRTNLILPSVNSAVSKESKLVG